MASAVETAPTTALTLGEVVRAALPDFAQTHRLPAHHWKVLRALAACHTSALGGHQYGAKAVTCCEPTSPKLYTTP